MARPERPEQHKIDSAAQRVFVDALPLGWVIRKQDPDYHNDYTVEIEDGGRLTGVRFDVQLKGVRAARPGGQDVAFVIETAHLAYYVDRCRLPVFLVVADVAAREAWWLFTQQYVLHELARKPWRGQGTVTVRLPRSQALSYTERLRLAVWAADKFMAGVRPTSVDAAVKAQRMRLESMDPRFSVEVSSNGGRTHFGLTATAPVQLRCVLKSPDAELSRRVDEGLMKGLPIRLDAG